MTALDWDQTGERLYETGVDHGVLYPISGDGDYPLGVAWNGLITVTETPAGAGATATYADNIKYLNLIAAETFGATIDAYTYPDEFAVCDGTVQPEPGVSVGQQPRKTFGLCYRTLVGNDVEGTELGFKLHLVWGAIAEPSQKAYGTVNDSPAAINFSWTINTTPVNVTDLKPTSLIVIDSTQVDSDALSTLLDILYGTEGVDPRLPLPDEVLAIFSGTVTEVRLVGTNAPTYDSGTHVVTIPSVANVSWKINGLSVSTGAQPAMTSGQTSVVRAYADPGYVITGDDDWTFDY